MLRVFSFFIFFIFAAGSQAALKIEITEGAEGAEPIAIVPFSWSGKADAPENVSAIVSADLHRSGRFAPLPEKDMLAKPSEVEKINFKNWRILEVPYLVIGNMNELPDGKYRVVFRLFDVYRAKQMTGFAATGTRGTLRRIAHQISDAIYKELTGERGAFATKLAYVKKLPKETNPNRRYWLFTADADTENEKPVLMSVNPIISPTWSPDSTKLAFVVVRGSGQSIYVYDVKNNTSERITFSKEKFSAPAWSPDGKQMAMVRLKDGGADIFVMDLKTKKKKRITRHWSIDTEPAWSPDGKSLVFTSERGGSPQLYEYNFSTTKVRRLTFEGKENLRASFSPDGTMITFVHSEGGKYHVAVMDMATQQIRLLTKASHEETEHESPSFAPNASMVIYAANYRNQRGVLAAVSVDGGVHQRFSYDKGAGEVREPAWSSFLD
ncbi:MAG: Tol-Pal system beta propeller repeat protein TolB [Gammaproteobacteria bacterium]|nr:Tol-Pal system beta propeller repeat protein TolB [Gammaproteobacteria bacterium]MDH5727470.1 Tol-Pal system beta propeller repeat protein TolB [Gammaproteobacteria bacterium]